MSWGGARPIFRRWRRRSAHPLAQRLFEIEGVAGVFLGADFVTITKDGDRDWYLLKPSILGVIMEHFTAGRPVINETESRRQRRP